MAKPVFGKHRQLLQHIGVSGSKNSDAEPDSSITAKKEALRKAMADLDLTPEQTSDDRPEVAEKGDSGSRDSDILGDVPPHHG